MYFRRLSKSVNYTVTIGGQLLLQGVYQPPDLLFLPLLGGGVQVLNREVKPPVIHTHNAFLVVATFVNLAVLILQEFYRADRCI